MPSLGLQMVHNGEFLSVDDDDDDDDNDNHHTVKGHNKEHHTKT